MIKFVMAFFKEFFQIFAVNAVHSRCGTLFYLPDEVVNEHWIVGSRFHSTFNLKRICFWILNDIAGAIENCTHFDQINTLRSDIAVTFPQNFLETIQILNLQSL